MMKTYQFKPWRRLCLQMMLLLCMVAPRAAWAAQEQADKAAKPWSEQPQSLPDYRLVPGDTIELKFFYNPDMNEVVQIRPDGKIAMPLVGDVELKGKTVPEASKMIEELYASQLNTPQVTIQIRSYAAQKVYVGGEVLRPGVVNLSSELTVLEAIMEAGGKKNTGSSSMVVLIRKGADNTPQIQKIPLQGKNGQLTAQALTLQLRPYDVVLVPESKIAKWDRWVDQYVHQAIPFAAYGSFNYVLNPGVIGQ